MIIGIDARVLQSGDGGVFVYAKNIIEHLIKISRNRHQIKLFANQRKKHNNSLIMELGKNQNVKLYQYRFPNKFLNASLKFLSWPNIDELVGGCDILFFPSMMYSSWSKKTKTVLTMHDLSFEIFPEFYTAKQNIWHKMMSVEELCADVDRIISVSKNTKADIINRYAIDAKKIEAIYSGLDDNFRPIRNQYELERVRKKYHLPANKKFILQAGTIQPRKNMAATLQAFERWQELFPSVAEDYELIFAGHKGWGTKNFIKSVEKSVFRDRMHLIYEIDKKDLPALYNLAKIFVYPSFYEGFGHPILEAFGCGVPVISSATSSLGEVVDGAGLVFDPYKIDDLVAGLHTLAIDEDFAHSLRAKGLARTVEFSWEKCARQTLRVLEGVIK